jgi:hypothetical protein
MVNSFLSLAEPWGGLGSCVTAPLAATDPEMIYSLCNHLGC